MHLELVDMRGRLPANGTTHQATRDNADLKLAHFKYAFPDGGTTYESVVRDGH